MPLMAGRSVKRVIVRTMQFTVIQPYLQNLLQLHGQPNNIQPQPEGFSIISAENIDKHLIPYIVKCTNFIYYYTVTDIYILFSLYYFCHHVSV